MFHMMMVYEKPATVPMTRNGKASENRDKSEDLPENINIQGFREQKRRITTDSPLRFLLRHGYLNESCKTGFNNVLNLNDSENLDQSAVEVNTFKYCIILFIICLQQ